MRTNIKENLRTGLILLLCILLIGGIVKLVQLASWKPSDAKIQVIERKGTLPVKPIYENYDGKG